MVCVGGTSVQSTATMLPWGGHSLHGTLAGAPQRKLLRARSSQPFPRVGFDGKLTEELGRTPAFADWSRPMQRPAGLRSCTPERPRQRPAGLRSCTPERLMQRPAGPRSCTPPDGPPAEASRAPERHAETAQAEASQHADAEQPGRRHPNTSGHHPTPAPAKPPAPSIAKQYKTSRGPYNPGICKSSNLLWRPAISRRSVVDTTDYQLFPRFSAACHGVL